MKLAATFLILTFTFPAFGDEYIILSDHESFEVHPDNIEYYNFKLNAEDNDYDVSIELEVPEVIEGFTFGEATTTVSYLGDWITFTVDPNRLDQNINLTVQGPICFLQNTSFRVRYINSKDEVRFYLIDIEQFIIDQNIIVGSDQC